MPHSDFYHPRTLPGSVTCIWMATHALAPQHLLLWCSTQVIISFWIEQPWAWNVLLQWPLLTQWCPQPIRYRNSSKYIPWLYLLVKSLHQPCHNPLWHNFHLRKPIDLIDMTLIDQSAKTVAVNAKTLEQPIRVEMPWGDHSCQHQWHQTNSQWHFCQ